LPSHLHPITRHRTSDGEETSLVEPFAPELAAEIRDSAG